MFNKAQHTQLQEQFNQKDPEFQQALCETEVQEEAQLKILLSKAGLALQDHNKKKSTHKSKIKGESVQREKEDRG